MPSSQEYSAAIAASMNAAIQKLNADITAGGGVNTMDFRTVQGDVEQYYSVQTTIRGYAGLAEHVVAESDYNGAIAISNLESFYNDLSADAAPGTWVGGTITWSFASGASSGPNPFSGAIGTQFQPVIEQAMQTLAVARRSWHFAAAGRQPGYRRLLDRLG